MSATSVIEWVGKPGMGALGMAVAVYIVRRIRGSERLRHIIGRSLASMFATAAEMSIVPVLTERQDDRERKEKERYDRIEMRLDRIETAQARIDAAVTAHMDSEDKARAEDMRWRKVRQAENQKWRQALERRVELLEAHLPETA